jgi:DNA-directed RNA polymerase subunit M/transcription elongation factor TFIIS
MSSSNPESPKQYPVACPCCQEEKGYPFQARTLSEQPGSIEVSLRCRECSHEWITIVPVEE